MTNATLTNPIGTPGVATFQLIKRLAAKPHRITTNRRIRWRWWRVQPHDIIAEPYVV